MAVLKHIVSKNANYGESLDYLLFQHDERTKKPILNEHGQMILREEYYLDGLNCEPMLFDKECERLNDQYHKNQTYDEIKSHHYIISFDPADRDECGLTGEKAQELGLEYARKNFPGHQALVCTHTDGHNESGNIHVHIVINSLRKYDIPKEGYMERNSDCLAGYKHHLTNNYLRHLQKSLMDTCHRENLPQVDLLSPSENKIKNREYYASRYGQEKLDKLNEQILADGLTPRKTTFQTQKQYLRDAITEISHTAKDVEDFKKQLALAMSEEKMPDIAVVDSSDFQFLHHMKAFADLTDAIPELKEYNEKALEPCTIDGRIYGQPFGVNCTGMFYNKKLLEENGCEVPESWEEFQETAAKISNEDVKGFAITALQTEESMYEFLPILWSMGGDVYRIAEENSKKAFLLLDQMEKEGSLSLQSISLTMGDLTNQFLKGKIGIMFNSSMAIDSIREGNPDLEFGVAPIPGGETSVSVAGGEILAVAENEKKEYAIRFLKFLADKDRMKEYIDAFGFLAPRQDIMEQQFAEDPEKRTFIKMYKAAGIREISPEWPRISLTLSDTLRQILVEEEDPQTILNKSAEKIEKIGAEK